MWLICHSNSFLYLLSHSLARASHCTLNIITSAIDIEKATKQVPRYYNELHFQGAR